MNCLRVILLTLGETWSKRSKFTSLLFVNFFTEVAEVNAKAFNIDPTSLGKKHCRGSAEGKRFYA